MAASSKREGASLGGAHPTRPDVLEFRERVWTHYHEHGRHSLPWRQTRDPYAILVSEVMLQQTQVSRVIPKYDEFLAEFPTVDALAAAPLEAVLRVWQGLGYNRRALWLKRAAERLSAENRGAVPHDLTSLERLPGIGRTTAAGVLVFAFGVPSAYLETNVRAAYLHEFFPHDESVPDTAILPLIDATLDTDDPRGWFYALLDYGSWLKRTSPNPSRRSAHHTRQTRFEGSRRQKRAKLLRAVLEEPGRSAGDIAASLGSENTAETLALLEELEREGFVAREGEDWIVA